MPYTRVDPHVGEVCLGVSPGCGGVAGSFFPEPLQKAFTQSPRHYSQRPVQLLELKSGVISLGFGHSGSTQHPCECVWSMTVP